MGCSLFWGFCSIIKMIGTQKFHMDPKTPGTIGNLRFQKKSKKDTLYFSASFLSLINPYRLKRTKESSTMLQETFDSCQEDGRSLFEIVSILKFQQLLLKCQAWILFCWHIRFKSRKGIKLVGIYCSRLSCVLRKTSCCQKS